MTSRSPRSCAWSSHTFTALRAKGIESTRYVLTGAGHGDLSFTGDTSAALPWSTQETMGHIVDFLGQHLKKARISPRCR